MSTYDQEVKKVKIELNTTDNSGNVQKYTIDYINPNATAEQLYTAARRLNDDLTTNTFVNMQRIEYSSVWQVD